MAAEINAGKLVQRAKRSDRSRTIIQSPRNGANPGNLMKPGTTEDMRGDTREDRTQKVDNKPDRGRREDNETRSKHITVITKGK